MWYLIKIGKLKWNRTPNKLWEMKQIQIGYCTSEGE